MRGEHQQAERQGRRHEGIIPACAGSTKSSTIAFGQLSGSSPHARGAQALRTLKTGYPEDHPRMRGEHRATAWTASFLRGIIPACAGSTMDGGTKAFGVKGSSPHVRGALFHVFHDVLDGEDHPRMCGEHFDTACLRR